MSAKKKLRLKIGEILLKVSSLTPEQLEEALTKLKEKEFAKLLGEILVSRGYVSKEDVETALAIQYGYPYIYLANYRIQPDVCKIFPRDFLIKHKIIPLEKIEDILTVAMSNVFDTAVIEEIKEKYGLRTRIFLASIKDIEEVIRRYY